MVYGRIARACVSGFEKDSVCIIKGAWGGQDESQYQKYTRNIPNVYAEYRAYSVISPMFFISMCWL